MNPPLALRPGILLVAPPMLRDPNFWRTVVLLCAHDAEGSFGLILNRPVTLTLRDVLEVPVNYPLSLGGPVQPDTLHILHQLGETIPNAQQVTDGVYWGGEVEALLEKLRTDPPEPERIRCFLGYAGWAPGQLEAEYEAGGWLVVPAQAHHVFQNDPLQLWRQVLRSMGGEYALLANFPEDPRLN